MFYSCFCLLFVLGSHFKIKNLFLPIHPGKKKITPHVFTRPYNLCVITMYYNAITGP